MPTMSFTIPDRDRACCRSGKRSRYGTALEALEDSFYHPLIGGKSPDNNPTGNIPF